VGIEEVIERVVELVEIFLLVVFIVERRFLLDDIHLNQLVEDIVEVASRGFGFEFVFEFSIMPESSLG
jgi:hypothetical protein